MRGVLMMLFWMAIFHNTEIQTLLKTYWWRVWLFIVNPYIEFVDRYTVLLECTQLCTSISKIIIFFWCYSNFLEMEDMMTTDDLLPILIFLIIKSETPNWWVNWRLFLFLELDFLFLLHILEYLSYCTITTPFFYHFCFKE